MLSRYKQLVESAIAVAHATAADVAVTGTGGLEAWLVLRQTSQNNNVKLRDLAVALIEYLGGEPAEQPAGSPARASDARADAVARAMWQQLMTHPDPG